MPLLSVITAAYNEEENLPLFYQRVAATLDGAGIPWELIVVDDHSRDNTFAVLCRMAASDARVRGMRLSRNVGSHTAVIPAIEKAAGDCIAHIASDLQHPPEMLPEMWARWQAGAQVVWVARAGRPEGFITVALARLYYLLMRRVAGLRDMPPGGADFFLLDRVAARALLECDERNTSILGLVSWMGFRQEVLHAKRLPRLHGRSAWTLGRKIKLVIDTIASFTYLPVRLMSYAGAACALAGIAIALWLAWRATAGHPAGWLLLVPLVLMLSGAQMLMLGVLGEYIWRALEEARRRPRYFVEADTSQPSR